MAIKDNNPTKKEHYVPRVYLKGFSEDGQTIYFYDLLRKKNSDCAVPISTVCYEDNLYETKNEAGDFVNRNWVEKCLAELEKLFSKRKKQLETKAFCADNLSTNMFLKQDEKTFWALYILIQILRTPKTLDVAKEFCVNQLEERLGRTKAENIGLAFCLPFFEKLTDENQNIIKTLMEPMENMYMEIGVVTDESVKLFTSDSPVYIHCKTWPCEEYEKIVFPISSKLCLFMYGGKEKQGHKRNGLFVIGQRTLDEIFWSMAYKADGKIFSSERILGDMRKRVDKAHAERMIDETKKFI